MQADLAKGGTEILNEKLRKYVPNIFFDKVHISTHVPQSGTRHLKPFILWEHQSYDQPSVQGLKDERILSAIDRIVFVSEWQKEQYLKHFPIPAGKAIVIKNAIEPIVLQVKSASPLQLIYTSTPFRGLDVLLDAFQLLNKSHIELHIYSGMSLYGSARALEDRRFEPLYEKARSMDNVLYHGVVSNEKIRTALQEAHIFAYPCTWEETSCLSLIEAISTGCLAVVPKLGALPETASGFARLYSYIADKKLHAECFASELDQAIDAFWLPATQKRLQEQVAYFNKNYSWEVRKEEWTSLLQDILARHGKNI